MLDWLGEAGLCHHFLDLVLVPGSSWLMALSEFLILLSVKVETIILISSKSSINMNFYSYVFIIITELFLNRTELPLEIVISPGMECSSWRQPCPTWDTAHSQSNMMNSDLLFKLSTNGIFWISDTFTWNKIQTVERGCRTMLLLTPVSQPKRALPRPHAS